MDTFFKNVKESMTSLKGQIKTINTQVKTVQDNYDKLTVVKKPHAGHKVKVNVNVNVNPGLVNSTSH